MCQCDAGSLFPVTGREWCLVLCLILTFHSHYILESLVDRDQDCPCFHKTCNKKNVETRLQLLVSTGLFSSLASQINIVMGSSNDLVMVVKCDVS